MKLKQIISTLALSAVVVSSVSLTAFAAPKRTAIKTAQQLMSMKKDGDYYLVSDIDLSKTTWKPIKDFAGSFDGNGYEIKNLKSDTYGLFSSLKSGAHVTDVELTDIYLTSKYKSVGGVVSVISQNEKNVVVEDCSVSGVVASCLTKYKTKKAGMESTAGAIVGVNNSPSSVVSDCYSNAVVAAETTVGGIVGKNLGTVKNSGFGGELANSYNVYELRCQPGQLMTEEYAYMTNSGGICGISSGKIEGCVNNYTRMETAKYYGGIVGSLQSGSVTKCVNASNKVWHDDETKGGLIAGYANSKATLNNCYTRLPNNQSVQNDVGEGKTGTKSYGVRDENFNKIAHFKNLGSGWQIANGVPMPTSIKDKPTASAWHIQGTKIVAPKSNETKSSTAKKPATKPAEEPDEVESVEVDFIAMTPKERADNSDNIVVGKVTSIKPGYSNDNWYFSKVNIKVSSNLKGNTKTTQISIPMYGGTDSKGMRHEYSGAPVYKVGDEVLLYLKPYTKSPNGEANWFNPITYEGTVFLTSATKTETINQVKNYI